MIIYIFLDVGNCGGSIFFRPERMGSEDFDKLTNLQAIGPNYDLGIHFFDKRMLHKAEVRFGLKVKVS